MKKLIVIGMSICTTLLFLVGCGHTVFASSKGIGIDVSWNPDTMVPSFRGGEYNVQSFVPRGNSAMTMTTSTGGVLGTGGTSQSISVSTGTQWNEGNIVKVFDSPFVSKDTKEILARHMANIIRDPVPATESSARTAYAAGATGKDAIKIQTETTGTDKIVDRIAENGENIKDVANKVTETTGKTIETGLTVSILSTKWVLIVSIIGIVLIIFIIIISLRKIIPWITDIFNKKKVTGKSIIGTVIIENQNDNQFLSSEKNFSINTQNK